MRTNETQEELKVKEYISKYIKELQRHFEVSDRKMRRLIHEVYKDLAPFNFIKIINSMVESFYKINFKDLIKRK